MLLNPAIAIETSATVNRTSDPMHKDMVRIVFEDLLDAGFLERTTMQQYCSISNGEVRFLPDRYVEGTCPVCSADGARGDQCDDCGSTYEANQLRNPVSKLDPTASVEIRDTDHMFSVSIYSRKNLLRDPRLVRKCGNQMSVQ